MGFYIGLAQVIGLHSLLGLSVWCVLHTGQVSLAQGGFFAIGAYASAMLTAMAGWPLFSIVRQLHGEGVSIFLVEQNAHMALQVAQHFYLMEQGRISFSGNPGELAEDDAIQRAYLGQRRAA